jgi:hypothetical protein
VGWSEKGVRFWFFFSPAVVQYRYPYRICSMCLFCVSNVHKQFLSFLRITRGLPVTIENRGENYLGIRRQMGVSQRSVVSHNSLPY